MAHYTGPRRKAPNSTKTQNNKQANTTGSTDMNMHTLDSEFKLQYRTCITMWKAVLVILASYTVNAIPVRNDDWIQLGKPKPSHELALTFAIKRTNPGWLDDKLRDVAYPDSPEYGKYMNFDEIAKYVHGRPESVQTVVDVLASVGVGKGKIDFTLGMDFAIVTIPVVAAETLFAADFYAFQYLKTKERIIVKCLTYTVPESLTEHLDFVAGLTEFPPWTILSMFPQTDSVLPQQCRPTSSTLTPSDINRAYNLSSYTSTSPSNSQAVAGFLDFYFSPDDLDLFQRKYGVPLNPISKILGKNDPNLPALEPDLDTQYITATGRNVSTWFVSQNEYGPGPDNPWLSWIIKLVNTTDAPWVHSVSYGGYSNPVDLQMRCDDEFKKFGISGRTLLISSGDDGVNCGRNSEYTPEWPTSSPHVTSVGGTATTDDVWQCGGGGFSNVFPTPDYQKDVVKTYLASGEAPPTHYFNTAGRAFPDVSAFAWNLEIIYNREVTTVAGTRASTPTFAGIVSCLNDVRLRNGLPTLGFLNPLLYQVLKGKGFHDITQGNNSGDETCPGFTAIQGWDPASGWGTPNFGVLRDLVLRV